MASVSPRTHIIGNINSNIESISLYKVAERNQEKFPSKITVLYSSGEIANINESHLRVSGEEIIFFDSDKDVVDYILTHDVYPYNGTPYFDDERMDILFRHILSDREIYSNYMLFDQDYYEEIKKILLSLF